MPEEPKTWADILREPPIPCPAPNDQGLEVQHKTHTSQSTAVIDWFSDEVTFSQVSGRTSLMDLEPLIEAWLEEEPVPEELLKNLGQLELIRFNEAGVSDANLLNILKAVIMTLREKVLPILKASHIAFERYTFQPIPQASAGDRGRCDRFIALHTPKDNQGNVKSEKNMNLVSEEEFWAEMDKWKAWYKAKQSGTLKPGDLEPELPDMIVDVLEDKRPNVIFPDAFAPGYWTASGTPAHNVRCIIPQVRKYSVDSMCKHITVSEYSTLVVLEVKYEPMERNKGANKKTAPYVVKADAKGRKAEIIVTRREVDVRKSRLLYFTMVMQHLVSAQILEFPSGGKKGDPKAPKVPRKWVFKP
ncbi:hypothetical protein EXIGLDRAFT_844198 [Exidia glandulosa HHB12029]|uniref:Uncharacterized protein n=1 Tax=Exidia glandulosa HHB12029 TaxID=1314781 RepID=A0A165C627_EXIGL|nr:hypothetical protein EXIGLDRAFT_844198 [Exidia glandulosa HHB12029]